MVFAVSGLGLRYIQGPREVLLRGLVLPGGDLGSYRVQGEGSGYEAQGLGCLVVPQNRPFEKLGIIPGVWQFYPLEIGIGLKPKQLFIPEPQQVTCWHGRLLLVGVYVGVI